MRIVVVIALLVTASAASAQVQDLGHRLPGGVGLDAGSQVPQGLYVGYRFAWFASQDVHDRHGNDVPIAGLDIDAFAHIFGVAGTLKLGEVYLSAALAVPYAKLSLRAVRPEASVDRLGLGDIFIEPLKVGRRFARADAVASYSLYAPTSQGARSSVGRPQWTHQLAAGGTVFFDDRRGWRVSALASYQHSLEKQGVAIQRGDTLLLQGGAGGPIFDGVELGIVGYALWQVTDDTGRDLPPQLRGARERAFGLGPELGITIPPLRSRVVARIEWDLDGKARPVGSILVVGLSAVAWR